MTAVAQSHHTRVVERTRVIAQSNHIMRVIAQRVIIYVAALTRLANSCEGGPIGGKIAGCWDLSLRAALSASAQARIMERKAARLQAGAACRGLTWLERAIAAKREEDITALARQLQVQQFPDGRRLSKDELAAAVLQRLYGFVRVSSSCFTILAGRTRPSAGIGVIDVQKLRGVFFPKAWRKVLPLGSLELFS